MLLVTPQWYAACTRLWNIEWERDVLKLGTPGVSRRIRLAKATLRAIEKAEERYK
jgi:hypothetical protein